MPRLSRVAVDVRPLRSSPAFRRLWFGTGVSAVGSQITTVASPIQVWEETHSTFLAGLVGIAALVPLLTVSIVAGAVADAVDRRRLLLASDVALALATVVLVLAPTRSTSRPSPPRWSRSGCYRACRRSRTRMRRACARSRTNSGS